MDDSLDRIIQNNAAGPRRAAGDSGSVEQHPLRDQIETDRYVSVRSYPSCDFFL